MPTTDLLSPHVAHIVPVRSLLFPRRIGAEREPADSLLLLHAPLVVNGDEQGDVGELEQSNLRREGVRPLRHFSARCGGRPWLALGCPVTTHLKDEGLLEQRVGLAPAQRRLGACDLLAGATGQPEADVGVGRACHGQVAEVASLDELHGQTARRAVVGQAQQQLGHAAVLHRLARARRVAACQRKQVRC